VVKTSTVPGIAQSLHPARLDTYLRATRGHERKAISLYLWNVRLSAAFQEVLALVEVGLRNALDQELRIWVSAQSEDGVSSDWLLGTIPRPLNRLVARKTHESMLFQAKTARGLRPDSHPRRNAEITHDDLLAQMNFGTLRALMPTSNENAKTFPAKSLLWRQALVDAFPYLDCETDPHGWIIGDRVARLHHLRNRVAHMEPLLNVSVPARLTDAYSILGAINPDLRSTASGLSRVRPVLESDPRTRAPRPRARRRGSRGRGGRGVPSSELAGNVAPSDQPDGKEPSLE
jgi:hypothetical protein